MLGYPRPLNLLTLSPKIWGQEKMCKGCLQPHPFPSLGNTSKQG